MIQKNSLSQTVDAIGQAIHERRQIRAAERKRVASWLVARQGLPGAYAETFAGFAAEQKSGIVLFTGERINSASARHILGEETCRALRLLAVRDSGVKAALKRADAGLMQCLERAALDPRNTNPGRYCCGKCSVGLWRNLLSGGLDRQEERLRKGVMHLRSVRDGQGEWQKFPFWYTVLALSDADLPEARRELTYAAPVLERAVRKAPASTQYARRRHELASRALAAL